MGLDAGLVHASEARCDVPGMPSIERHAMTQEFFCGGSGKLTPEAMVELEAFRRHLQFHRRSERIDGCRFCKERGPLAARAGDTNNG